MARSEFYHQHVADYLETWTRLSDRVIFKSPLEQLAILSDAREAIVAHAKARTAQLRAQEGRPFDGQPGFTNTEAAQLAAIEELRHAREVGFPQDPPRLIVVDAGERPRRVEKYDRSREKREALPRCQRCGCVAITESAHHGAGASEVLCGDCALAEEADPDAFWGRKSTSGAFLAKDGDECGFCHEVLRAGQKYPSWAEMGYEPTLCCSPEHLEEYKKFVQQKEPDAG